MCIVAFCLRRRRGQFDTACTARAPSGCGTTPTNPSAATNLAKFCDSGI